MSGIPYVENTFIISALIVAALWFWSGMASVHLVKKSWITNRYLLLWVERGTWRISIATVCHGHPIGRFVNGALLGIDDFELGTSYIPCNVALHPVSYLPNTHGHPIGRFVNGALLGIDDFELGTSYIPCNVALHPVPYLPNKLHVAVTVGSF